MMYVIPSVVLISFMGVLYLWWLDYLQNRVDAIQIKYNQLDHHTRCQVELYLSQCLKQNKYRVVPVPTLLRNVKFTHFYYNLTDDKSKYYIVIDQFIYQLQHKLIKTMNV